MSEKVDKGSNIVVKYVYNLDRSVKADKLGKIIVQLVALTAENKVFKRGKI